MSKLILFKIQLNEFLKKLKIKAKLSWSFFVNCQWIFEGKEKK